MSGVTPCAGITITVSGPHELASEVVEAGQPAPIHYVALVAGAGYAVCVDFPMSAD
nr:hypothetical protein [Citrobacter freundii]